METKNPRHIARAMAQLFVPLKIEDIPKVNQKDRWKYYAACTCWFIGVFVCGPVVLWSASHSCVQCCLLVAMWILLGIIITHLTRMTAKLTKQGGAPKKEAMALEEMFTDNLQAMKFNSFMRSREKMSAPQVRSLLDYIHENHLDVKVSRNMLYCAVFEKYKETFTFKHAGGIRQAKPDDSIIMEYKKYEKLG